MSQLEWPLPERPGGMIQTKSVTIPYTVRSEFVLYRPCHVDVQNMVPRYDAFDPLLLGDQSGVYLVFEISTV